MKLAALTALVAMMLATVPQALANEGNLEGNTFSEVAAEVERYQPAAETMEVKGHSDSEIWEMTRPGIERDGGVDVELD